MTNDSSPTGWSIEDLNTVEEAATAIREMHVRGAPLIGVTAAFGMYLAALQARPNHFRDDMNRFADILKATRPTAVNLTWAVDQQLKLLQSTNNDPTDPKALLEKAMLLKKESIDRCRKIGENGCHCQNIFYKKQNTVNILTHCNAGWLACIDYGTATAPMYAAQEAGIPITRLGRRNEAPQSGRPPHSI